MLKDTGTGFQAPLLCMRFTWGRFTLPDQEGALRVPGSQEAPVGFISRNVLEEPPAAEAHSVIHTGSEPHPLPPTAARVR